MEAFNDKRMKVATRKSEACIATLLLFALSCFTLVFLLSKQSQRDDSRMIADFRSAEADACADDGTKDEMSGDDSGTPIEPLSESEQAELFSAVSNIVSAYSNKDARAVQEFSAHVLDFIESKKQQISTEMCVQTLEPIKRVLLDHFCVRKRCGDFNTAEELEAHFALDMEILSFFFEASLKRDLTIIDDRFELIALQSAGNTRRIYEGDSRDDMLAVCDKWIGKLKERIDSENCYVRIKLKRSYLRDIEYWQNWRRSGSTGTYLTDEDIRRDCYHAVEFLGRLYGYTPKWIKEYEPLETQNDRAPLASGADGAK